MQDRTPKYPGRVALVPVTGADNIYDMVRADEPIEEGNPLSKVTFLKDATATLLGFSNPKTTLPDDALRVLNATYGTCGTSSGTVAKVVVCPNFILKTGARIAVRFSATNTANNPTLNVNGTGAKAIARYGSSAPFPYMWQAGAVVEFFYDGNRWIMLSGTTATTTYYGPTILYDGIDSTSTTMAATANAVKKALSTAEASIMDKAAGTANFTARRAISVGDIVDIDGNYADKNLKFSAENSTVQKDVKLGYILSDTRAVRIVNAAGRTVQLQRIGTTTLSIEGTFTLALPEGKTSGSVYEIFPIDSASFLYFLGYYYSGEESSGYSWEGVGYAYISGGSLYSFASTFSLFGSYFVNNNYLPVPGKKALYALDRSDNNISKLTVNTSSSTVAHSAMYPYWTYYDTPQDFFLCVLPDETLVVCSEQERSTNPNSRLIRILDPSTNGGGSGPRGSAKIVSSSADLRAGSSLQNNSWMTSIAVSTTTFLTVFADYYAVFTTRSGTTFTNGEPFKLFDETVQSTYDISLQHFSDTKAMLVTKDKYGVVRYRLIGQDKSISEPTVVQPPNPSDGNPYTDWKLVSGHGNLFISLTQKENSVTKYSTTKLLERNYSKDAIAMSSASAYGTVKVCLEGNMALSSAKRGQFIKSADGETVAYCYTNGMINVIPQWNRVSRDIPPGLIMLWSGSIIDIPSGWALCDGENGTPDLRDKFVLAAGGAKAPGDFISGSGGSTTVSQVYISNSGVTTYHNNATAVLTGVGSKDAVVPYYALAYIMKV